MATLKEAVESGRRWRHASWTTWYGPGGVDFGIDCKKAISSDFVIEPEKPREIVVCEHRKEVGGVMQHFARIPSNGPCNCGEYGCSGRLKGVHHIYHDADACDRLKGKA